MNDSAAQEWLAVAASEVAHLPPDILADACAKARKKCTHHGQIVPNVLEASHEWLSARRAIVKPERIPHERRIEEKRWTPTQAEIAAIHAEVAESLKAK